MCCVVSTTVVFTTYLWTLYTINNSCFEKHNLLGNVSKNSFAIVWDHMTIKSFNPVSDKYLISVRGIHEHTPSLQL